MGTREFHRRALLIGAALLIPLGAATAWADDTPADPGTVSAESTGAAGPAGTGLRVEATGTPVRAARGARVTYTVQAHNPGPRTTDAAVHLASLTSGVAIVAAESDPGCLIERKGYVCTRPALRPGETASWTIAADIDDDAAGTVRLEFAEFTASRPGRTAAGAGSGTGGTGVHGVLGAESGAGTAGGANGTGGPSAPPVPIDRPAAVTTMVDAAAPVADAAAVRTSDTRPPATETPTAPSPSRTARPAAEAKDPLRSLPLTGGSLLGLGATAGGLLVAGATLRMIVGSRRRGRERGR